MKQYSADKIKNIAIVGHGGSGKTTLAEAILYKTNAIDRLGNIAQGNTVCDFEAEEIKRKSSISMALAPFEYKDIKVNLLDAPGLFDFTTGMYEAIKACDCALLTVSGKSGVTVGAKKAYDIAKEKGKSRVIFISKLDRESADFYKILEQLKSIFGPSVFPLSVPFGDKNIEGYVDLLKMKAYTYQDGVAKEREMPESEHRIDGLKTAISEAVAETDEELFEKYFSGEQFTDEEIKKGIKSGIKDGSITPVFCGSALTLEGIDMLIDAIYNLLPPASDIAGEIAQTESGDAKEISCSADGPLAVHVFKTVSDPFIGRLSYVKVISGVLKSGVEIKNAVSGQSVRVGKLAFMRGKKQEDADAIYAGDIGVIIKTEVNTGDTLYDKEYLAFEKASYSKPCYSMAITPKSKGDENKISQGIARLLEEDAALSFKLDTETHQQVISGLGEQHLDVLVSKLKAKFGVDVELEEPVVAYRETIQKKVKVQGRHKKQSGGHGQFGDVWIEFEPCECEDMIFDQKIVGGAVPKGYFPAVEKGLREAIAHGVLAGYPVVNLKATLVDGSYHPVDSSEMSFKMAAHIAYKAGMQEASPILLEPIGHLTVTVPDANTGDMMGELNKRRGRVLGMSPADDGNSVIDAEVPMSNMHDFAILVRQMTQGSGTFNFDFERYEQLPNQLVADVIEKAKLLFAKED